MVLDIFCCCLFCFFFFFSSRRRHTRCLSDWSSDVCSSDLCVLAIVLSLTPRQSGSPLRSVCDAPCCLHPAPEVSACWSDYFSRLLCVHFCYGPMTCSPS